MQPCNPDHFDLADMFEMLCRLPIYKAQSHWRSLIWKGGLTRPVALEICADIAIECNRIRAERQEALDRLTKADEATRSLISTLDLERKARKVQVTKLENTIQRLNELVVRQQQKLNDEAPHEDHK